MSRPKTPFAEKLKPLARALRVERAARPVVQQPLALPSDEALFRAAVKDVAPLRRPLPYPHPAEPVSDQPLQHQQDEARVMHDAMTDYWPWDEIETGEELLYLRSGQRLDTLKRLRRGQWVVQAHLDLHGLNTDEARTAVGGFLHRCVQEDRRCVRIVHGKGLGSPNREPVLKNKLRNWLAQRDEVLAFCQARQVDGGAGAVLVLLRGLRR